MANIIFDNVSTPQSFAQNIALLEKESATIIILSADANGFTPDDVDGVLTQTPSAILGAIFPSIIFKNKKYDQGSIFVGLEEKMTIHTLRDISLKAFEEVDAEVEAHLESFDATTKTIFAFVDGLTSNIAHSISALFDNYGLEINYIGGGSGSLSFLQKPSLFTNTGLMKDVFVYGYSKLKSSIGVEHGWRSIKGPFEVTRSEMTIIQELDHRPAFEVYKEVVDAYSSMPIEEANFFEVAKSFPFGINTTNDEHIVRDPIVLRGTELVCIGNVATGSYVDILQGESKSLINAAKGAAQMSAKGASAFESDFVLFIDCISRVLFLESEFDEELNAVYQEGLPLVGALTFGEIANNGHAYLEFFNKTAVIGQIGHAK